MSAPPGNAKTPLWQIVLVVMALIGLFGTVTGRGDDPRLSSAVEQFMPESTRELTL